MAPFFIFVLATVFSLVLGHVANGFHKYVERWEERSAVGLSREDSNLPPHIAAERSMQRQALAMYFPSSSAAYGLALSLVLTAGLILLGACVDSFQLIQSGVIVVFCLEPQDLVSSLGLTSLGVDIVSEAPNSIGLRVVQLIFFSFTLIIPLLSIGALVVLLLAPLRYRSQKVLLEACQVLDAWAAMDVFAMAVAVFHFEAGLMSRFLMQRNNLAQLSDTITRYLKADLFHMECGLTPGFVALMTAGIASFAVPKVTFAVCRVALEEREEAETERHFTVTCESDSSEREPDEKPWRSASPDSTEVHFEALPHTNGRVPPYTNGRDRVIHGVAEDPNRSNGVDAAAAGPNSGAKPGFDVTSVSLLHQGFAGLSEGDNTRGGKILPAPPPPAWSHRSAGPL
jgi:hypothetical protein